MRLGRDIVHIKVGRDLQDFGIHKSLICNASSFFSAAFNSDFEEGVTGIMKMEETEVDVFDLFYTWLYSGKKWFKESGDSNPSQKTLVHLHVFANMVHIPALKNASLRRLCSLIKEEIPRDLFIEPEIFSYVWKNTTSLSPRRRLIIDLCVWRIDFSRVFVDLSAPEISSEICFDIMKAMGMRL
jgi:hypothetical protein